jgi:hypothetical protein
MASSFQTPQPDVSAPVRSGPTGDKASAHKRLSIGLSARRPTAPASVLRPPNARVSLSTWWPVVCLVLLLLAVTTLVGASLLQPDLTLGEVIGRPGQAVGRGALFADSFDQDRGLWPPLVEPGVAATQVLPAEGSYRLDVWPGFLAWSRFAVEDKPTVALAAVATIDAQTPDAAVALIGRFSDERNFYLLTLDGEGRFGAVRYVQGQASVLRAPTQLPKLSKAGQPNRLVLEDAGGLLRFSANDILLDEIGVEPVQAGPIGAGALATGSEFGAVSFDSLRVYVP